MANSIATYTDSQIMKCLLTRNFADIGGVLEDDAVTKIKPAAFYKATNLGRVTLPAVAEIGSLAFSQSSIASIDLDWSKVTTIGGGAFNQGCTGYPMNLSLPALTAMGSAAFAGTNQTKNTQLRTISLASWTGTTTTQDGFSASGGIFTYCSALTEISAPELLAVPSDFCSNCTALEEVSFPKAASIGSGAFSYCTNLKKIDIGGAVTALNSKFIASSSKMETIILRGITAVPRLGASTFTSTRVSSGACYIYVPQSLEATVKVASNWSTYAAQIRAIEDYPDVCGS